MKIENGIIKSATQAELFGQYLKQGYDDIFSFPEYLQRMKNAGVKIDESVIIKRSVE